MFRLLKLEKIEREGKAKTLFTRHYPDIVRTRQSVITGFLMNIDIKFQQILENHLTIHWKCHTAPVSFRQLSYSMNLCRKHAQAFPKHTRNRAHTAGSGCRPLFLFASPSIVSFHESITRRQCTGVYHSFPLKSLRVDLFRMDWLLPKPRTQGLSPPQFSKHFLSAVFSPSHIRPQEKTILTRWTLVAKVIILLLHLGQFSSKEVGGCSHFTDCVILEHQLSALSLSQSNPSHP